jgi:oligoribonuclease
VTEAAEAALSQPLVWLDLEMTGLDPRRHAIVEIAVIVTDGQLSRVEEGPDLVVHQPEAALQAMEEVVARMHAANGLTQAVRASDVSLAAAEQRTLEFVRRWVPQARTAPLAGNSVYADRAFLVTHMPALEAHLHYRNVDVSTLKELARRWRPDVLESMPKKAGDHRALADIRESIDELRHYRASLFRDSP